MLSYFPTIAAALSVYGGSPTPNRQPRWANR